MAQPGTKPTTQASDWRPFACGNAIQPTEPQRAGRANYFAEFLSVMVCLVFPHHRFRAGVPQKGGVFFSLHPGRQHTALICPVTEGGTFIPSIEKEPPGFSPGDLLLFLLGLICILWGGTLT